MIISSTPFRISLFGGGTDYPQWFRDHGGAVIGMAIDKNCFLSVRELPPFFDHKSRIVYSQVELINKIEAALRRIEEGSYGYCDETGEQIGVNRLEARPIATLSLEAQEIHEKQEKKIN